MKYQLADQGFSSLEKIKVFFRQMRDKYMSVLGQPITDNLDISSLLALTEFIKKGHYLPYWQYFTVMCNKCNTHGFRMMLKSGITETVSFSLNKYSQQDKILDALRYAIHMDILTLRALHPDSECVHHDLIYFKYIATEFIKLHQEINVMHMEAGGFELVDNFQREQWVDFHRNQAALVAVTYEEHRREHAGRAN